MLAAIFVLKYHRLNLNALYQFSEKCGATVNNAVI